MFWLFGSIENIKDECNTNIFIHTNICFNLGTHFSLTKQIYFRNISKLLRL